MITDTEFVIIENFDRTLADNTRHAQGIIDRKNARLVQADIVVTQLRRELEIERVSGSWLSSS